MKISKARILSNMTNLINNYMWYVLLFLGGLFISCAGSNIPEQKEQHLPESPYHFTEYLGWGFSVQVPKTMVVSSQVCIDFLLYKFGDISEAEEEGLLFGFAGNYPDFRNLPAKNPKKTSIRIHGLKAKVIQWKDENNLHYREVLVKMPYKYEENAPILPEYVHFWYKGLSDEEKKIADKIIKSVRPVENDSESSP